MRKVDMTIHLREITADTLIRDAETTSRLAHAIWTEHYLPLIGAEMIAYMLENFQSPEQIRRDIQDNGFRYWLAEDTVTDQAIAYCAAFPQSNLLFLSKIYVLNDYRHCGIARGFLDLLKTWCAEFDLFRVQLMVARSNTDSIAAYQKMGFKLIGTRRTGIGGGFDMNDYVMELQIDTRD